MGSFLKTHPFAVEAWFDSSIVLTFAVPKAEVLPLIPPCVEPDTFQDKWAFIAVAMVQTRHLRPKGFPKFLGNDFFLIGYRVFVKYHTSEGKRLRGLYILKSETDKKKMERLGNVFTHYSYSTTDIQLQNEGPKTLISSVKSGFSVEVSRPDGEVALPQGSPFSEWKEARRFAGPLPFTFTWLKEESKVLIIQGMRQNWTPKPIQVVSNSFSFLEELNVSSFQLANAFEITNVPYWWKKGRKDPWKA